VRRRDPGALWTSPRRIASAGLAALALGWIGCGPPDGALCVVDPDGAPLADAWASVDGRRIDADRRGRIRWRGPIPAAAVATAEGFLPEPVVIAGGPACDRVALTPRDGAIALHFGGDFMLGRRYLAPDEGEPLLRAGSVADDARALVAPLALGFGVADVSMVNLETIVGDLPLEEACPAKRWLLQTPPEALAALDALGTDAVILANNHVADWEDAGVVATLDALDAAGLPSVGAGLDAFEAGRPLVLDVSGVRVAVLAYTSVDGDFVNDQLPTDDDEPPSTIPEFEAPLWELRSWGEPALGVPVATRRAGSVWRIYRDAEARLDEADATSLWRSARRVYPELQNWAARRGQGGAARWDPEASPSAIRSAASSADLVLVQLHMGMQFADAPSAAVVAAAEDAAAAGADLVIAHHPHVLQGIRWTDGALVAYSLGNLAFDQNFMSTFDSGYLRVVFDGEVRSARFVPLSIEGYRPLPIGGPRADDVLGRVAHRSGLDAVATRRPDLHVVPVAAPPVGEVPSFTVEHGTLRIWRPDQIPRARREIVGDDVVALPPGTVGRPAAGARTDGVAFGEALLRIGDFEAHVADPVGDPRALWDVPGPYGAWTDRHAATGTHALQLVRGPQHQGDVAVRPVARLPLPATPVVLDGPLDPFVRAPLEVEATVRVEGERDRVLVRFDAYYFTDVDPLAEPSSTVLASVEVPLHVAATHRWERLRVPVPAELLAPVGGVTPNFVLPSIRMRPARARTTAAWIDDLEIVAWRPASDHPEVWSRIDRVSGGDGVALELLLAP
jgi:poly-gamma-glutamate capsule biosynthesis protein CapA/YwtB (metallophosphatase superfamily)